jgi:hypothetical protein
MFAALALATARPAQAKTACWKQVITDWTADERIDNVYALHCYPEAIAHVPEDLRVYSSIVDDILAARLQVVRGVSRLPAAHSTVSRSQKTSEPRQALFKEAFNTIGPRNADSVPLPLLILGGLSLLLVAAGGVGLVSRRLRTNRTPAS